VGTPNALLESGKFVPVATAPYQFDLWTNVGIGAKMQDTQVVSLTGLPPDYKYTTKTDWSVLQKNSGDPSGYWSHNIEVLEVRYTLVSGTVPINSAVVDMEITED
jgi:hypothetical protein